MTLAIQLVSNDLMDSSDLKVGLHLVDLVTLLHDHYKKDLLICVYHTLGRSSLEVLFNKNLGLLNKYVKTVLEPIPCAFLWSHRGFWNAISLFLSRDMWDSVHMLAFTW